MICLNFSFERLNKQLKAIEINNVTQVLKRHNISIQIRSSKKVYCFSSKTLFFMLNIKVKKIGLISIKLLNN